MAVELEPRPRRYRVVAAAAGALVLVPTAAITIGGAGDLGMALAFAAPYLMLGGLVLALLVNVGASIRLRSRRTDEAVEMECDVRLHYRVADPTVILVVGGLAAAILVLT
jgi:hypothetical protein